MPSQANKRSTRLVFPFKSSFFLSIFAAQHTAHTRLAAYFSYFMRRLLQCLVIVVVVDG